jgi:hypothetical protein
MKPKDKAISLVDSYRIILMNEDTECGEEILCTVIAKQCALIAVDELIEHLQPASDFGGEINIYTVEYWQEVKQEILAL